MSTITLSSWVGSKFCSFRFDHLLQLFHYLSHLLACYLARGCSLHQQHDGTGSHCEYEEELHSWLLEIQVAE